MASKFINITLKIWRQKNTNAKGAIETYSLQQVSTDSSFLEMLDQLNEQLINEQKEPVAFDHDCREGICGMCSLYINGRAHGPETGTTTCQLHMRSFADGDTIYVEPWRSRAFPIDKDLVFFSIPATAVIKNAYQFGLGYEFSDKMKINGVYHYGTSNGATTGNLLNPMMASSSNPYGAIPGTSVGYKMNTSMIMVGITYDFAK